MDIENPSVESIENTQEPEIQQDTPQGEAAAEIEAYSPDFKFKVGESEHEFDERVRGVLKSKEDEEYFRDLYTKAYGLDVVKKRHEEKWNAKEQEWQTKESEYSGLRSQFDRVQNTIQKLNTLKGQDFGVFQKAWDIPNQAILQRASEILQVHGDPEAQARADKVYADRLQMLQYEDRVNQESQTQQAMTRQLHEMKLHQALMSPDIIQFAAEYDKRMGQGAFLEEVNMVGTIDHAAGKGYTDPKDAVTRAQQKLAKLIGPLGSSPASVSPPAASQQQQKPVQRPALPNLGSGRTGTAVSKKPKTMADLKKLAEQLSERD
ncbi:MAG TPA: hypothetical protein VE954_43060 [Oligoflexus sp.]|uniref:hypothetical protein n=1 Tax=Oligoflexus sp. TaxID=1971216 RepID=UPI002D540396|nr:hypothetical protein [Oligoflexus sp.]HYX39924.1 hypothetical protein [Oligoflexus sp.]